MQHFFLLVFARGLVVRFYNRALRNLVPLLQVYDLLVLSPYHALILFEDFKQILSLHLQFVLRRAKVRLEISDIFIEPGDFVVL